MKAKSSNEVNRIPLVDAKGKKSETIELNKDIFNGDFNEALLYQSVRMYRANQRRGCASTKTRGQVQGSGRKPWRQKGTGRARVGSIRSPLWRSGGIVFGPHPRDFRYTLPKKMKRNAFISSLNAKLKSGRVSAIEDMSVGEPKTKKVCALLGGFNLKERTLLLVKKIDKNLFLATRNLKKLTLKKVDEVTALDILSNEHVVTTRGATEFLNKITK